MMLDLQHRGQQAAGITCGFGRTEKGKGLVSEVFPGGWAYGNAALGHVRYETSPGEPQPWVSRQFSLVWNGHLNVEGSDTEYLARTWDCAGLIGLQDLDGSYSLAVLNESGITIARDPLGIKPLVWGEKDGVFAAASESIALTNQGFSVTDVEPGTAVTFPNREIIRFAPARPAHCFFEHIYFANPASVIDGQSVYLARVALGEELARLETESLHDSVEVPVPDTAKAAADAYAHALGIPCREGLIRNRYVGRTFIEGGAGATGKYTVLPEVLRGKRVFLVDDSIVRGNTMRALVARINEHAAEVHVRIACPHIVAPCFYGIAMPTVAELFRGSLGADSLRYLPVESLDLIGKNLCRACVTGDYPTPEGQRLYQIQLPSTQ
jgi:amidophosphoribosyltransferase